MPNLWVDTGRGGPGRVGTPGGIVGCMTAGLTAGPFDDVVASEASLKRFLHGLPGVDQVGAENRVALARDRARSRPRPRSGRSTSSISSMDLTTLEGQDTPGQGAGDVREGDASRPE